MASLDLNDAQLQSYFRPTTVLKPSNYSPISVQQQSQKEFVSVVEMATILNLSKSRFHALIRGGVFPKPLRHESCKRTVFDLELQRKCIEIRQTGIGHNGQPVLFNRMRGNGKPKKRWQSRSNHGRPIHDEHSNLTEALKSLGLTGATEAVGQALSELYPNGAQGIDQGEVIRAVFLHLRAKR